MTMMLNDLLKRTPLLAIVPFIVWMLGMTVYTIQWKTTTDYQLDRVVEASSQVAKQAERIIAVEQQVAFIREDIKDLKQFFARPTGGGK